MSNSNKQPPIGKLQKKALPNSLKLKYPIQSMQSIEAILGRLPFLRDLNEAQEQILAITPVWQKWCNKELASGQLSEYAALASIKGGQLIILCRQAIIATILKNQQASLLKAIHSAGFKHVKSIRVQMSLQNTSEHNQPETEPSFSKPETLHSKPSASTLKSMEATQSLIKNEQLAASLKSLTDSLKKAT